LTKISPPVDMPENTIKENIERGVIVRTLKWLWQRYFRCSKLRMLCKLKRSQRFRNNRTLGISVRSYKDGVENWKSMIESTDKELEMEFDL